MLCVTPGAMAAYCRARTIMKKCAGEKNLMPALFGS
jgi:hypothetical protein